MNRLAVGHTTSWSEPSVQSRRTPRRTGRLAKEERHGTRGAAPFHSTQKYVIHDAVPRQYYVPYWAPRRVISVSVSSVRIPTGHTTSPSSLPFSSALFACCSRWNRQRKPGAAQNQSVPCCVDGTLGQGPSLSREARNRPQLSLGGTHHGLYRRHRSGKASQERDAWTEIDKTTPGSKARRNSPKRLKVDATHSCAALIPLGIHTSSHSSS